jgi:signal transduction histidine kinase
VVKITDNGRGMPAQESVLGNGLKNMQKRVAESGGSIAITTGKDSRGVMLKIYYPLNIT